MGHTLMKNYKLVVVRRVGALALKAALSVALLLLAALLAGIMPLATTHAAHLAAAGNDRQSSDGISSTPSSTAARVNGRQPAVVKYVDWVSVSAAIISVIFAGISVFIGSRGLRRQWFLVGHKKELDDLDKVIDLFSAASARWLRTDGMTDERTALGEIHEKLLILDASPTFARDIREWKEDPCIDLLVLQNVLGDWPPKNFEALSLSHFHPGETIESYLKRKIQRLHHIKQKALT